MRLQLSKSAPFALLALILFVAACQQSSNMDLLVNCGNGRLDPGEQCDDGNLLDNDACLSTCKFATCGDGFVDLTREACDGRNFTSCGAQNTTICTCKDFQLGDGTLQCTSSCEFDTSGCGAIFTPTPNQPPTPTATATPTPSTQCGNGVIEAAETCDTCPADCTVQACSAPTPGPSISVQLTLPANETASGLTILVGYESSVVNLPGSGAAASVSARVRNRPPNTLVAVNDLDYALRLVLSRSAGFASGQIVTVDFDSCGGAPAPTDASFGCSVLGCANSFGSVQGCTCVANLD